MTRRRSAVLAATLLSCTAELGPARPQWIVELSTNATPPSFGARLWIDVMDQSGAVLPERQRIIDAPSSSDWPVSFGIEPGLEPAPRLRVRMYRFDATGMSGEPWHTSIVDLTAGLPALENRPLFLRLGLAMECFGVAPDLASHLSCDSRTGALAPESTLSELTAPLEVGSFRASDNAACQSEPPKGMACIPGGLFILGPTKLANSPLSEPLPLPPRLVQVSTFALDTEEMTVGLVKELVNDGRLILHDGQVRSGSICAFRDRTDADPMNCISWSDARDACAAKGKRLPTEAEWEFAAGNGADKTTYPWGDDAEICRHAWVGRSAKIDGDSSCREGSGMGMTGPLAGGQVGDVTRLGVRNLGGNLSEWTSDIARSYESACWKGAPVLVDPHCDVDANAPSTEPHRFRGGSWSQAPALARVDVRHQAVNFAGDGRWEGIGFRCALSPRQN
jgi:formylglycine-generating enzyme